MKFNWRKFSVVLAGLLAFAVLAAGCGGGDKKTGDKKELTFSKSQGPYSELFEKAVKPILEKKGYKITGKDMSDLLQADVVLNEGEVDFNVEQHTAYMENFNKKQKGHLVALTPIPTVPAGIYPGRKHDLKQLADGDQIAVPNDASNTARAYALLQKAGWIRLDPKKDLSTVTQQDIVENPHHLKFTEMKSLTIPGVRNDFDYIMITGSIVYNAKIDPKTALLTEDVLPHLLLQLVVNEKDKDARWARDLAAAYHSRELKEYLDIRGAFFVYWRSSTSGLFFLQGESPGAVPFSRMFVGRAGDAFRPDAAVDIFGKAPVFDEAGALTGVVGHVFPRARTLDAAVVHFQDQGAVAAVQVLVVQAAVQTEGEGLFQTVETGPVRQVEELFDGMGFVR